MAFKNCKPRYLGPRISVRNMHKFLMYSMYIKVAAKQISINMTKSLKS